MSIGSNEVYSYCSQKQVLDTRPSWLESFSKNSLFKWNINIVVCNYELANVQGNIKAKSYMTKCFYKVIFMCADITTLTTVYC